MSNLNLAKNLKGKTAINDLLNNNVLSSQNVSMIDIEKLIPYRKHPFKLYTDERLDNMVESIKERGIISPIIVRKIENDKYEILSGHNRTNAGKKAGLRFIPSRINNVEDDIADIIVVESNFIQRNKFLPSEKAKAYKLQLDALNRQGKKCSIGTEVSRDVVAKNNDTSSVQIQRFVRLNYLVDDLLQLVDNKKLSFRAGVEISYIDKAIQSSILQVIENGKKITLKQAEKLRELAKSKELTQDDIYELLTENKEIKEVKIPINKISKYFDNDMSEKEMLDTILKLLKSYKENNFTLL